VWRQVRQVARIFSERVQTAERPTSRCVARGFDVSKKLCSKRSCSFEGLSVLLKLAAQHFYVASVPLQYADSSKLWDERRTSINSFRRSAPARNFIATSFTRGVTNQASSSEPTQRIAADSLERRSIQSYPMTIPRFRIHIEPAQHGQRF
jgi:hypothetical protein